MTYDPQIHQRRSIRLKNYDYSQAGLYFVTICSQNRLCLFGNIADGEMNSNDAGEMVRTVWEQISTHYQGVEIDQFVVMPNHIHGIIALVGAGPRACPDGGKPGDGQRDDGQPQGVAPTGFSLSDVVHRFKTMTTKKYTDGVKQHDWQPFSAKLWQRNYYEHIIRNDESYLEIADYIQTNPKRWQEDTYHV